MFYSSSRQFRRIFFKIQNNFISYKTGLILFSSLSPCRSVNSPKKWTPYGLKSPDIVGINDRIDKACDTKLAYIALGSNLGDRVQMIEDSLNRMSTRGIRIKRTSSLWETEPMYVLDQEIFLNAVCEVETEFLPLDLLDQLQNIEKEMGRKKLIDKGPRNIDLDILLYGEDEVTHERLQIPHPGIHEREFVLRPLSELIPNKPLLRSSPWKITQDYLNALTPSNISTVTPLAGKMKPIHSLKQNRRTLIMAILNMNPDSFSDEKRLIQSPSYEEMSRVFDNFVNDGASIIDIGGQSTKPFAKNVSSEEEIARIIPVIEHARRFNSEINNIAISVDTYRAKVADAAIRAGADIVNDISAGTLDESMFASMAKLGKTVCLTHMRGTPCTMSSLTDYPEGIIPTIAQDLIERIRAAEIAGIRRWRIILDPGIGFAKTHDQNLEILRRFNELRTWPGLQGFPWLVGSSRKGFIGKITGVKVPHERIWGTSATVSAAVIGGADIVRVHDVKEMTQVAKMSDSIWRI